MSVVVVVVSWQGNFEICKKNFKRVPPPSYHSHLFLVAADIQDVTRLLQRQRRQEHGEEERKVQQQIGKVKISGLS